MILSNYSNSKKTFVWLSNVRNDAEGDKMIGCQGV